MPLPAMSLPRHSPSLLALLSALALGLASPAAWSQPVGSNPQGGQLTPVQRQKVFPEQRQMALQDHRARMAILERGERCIQGAADGEVLRTCMRDEREALRQQRRQHMERLKALYDRNGLPIPQWMQRQIGDG